MRRPRRWGGVWAVLGVTIALCTRSVAAAGARAEPSPAADSVWVVVEREATLGSVGTAEEVRRVALHGALADAVAQVTGVVVQSRASAVQSDSGGGVRASYLRSLYVEGRGTAVSWVVLSEGWAVRRVPGGHGVPTFRMRVRVLVARAREGPDPAFRASVRLASPVCITQSNELIDGDELRLSVQSSADAHWVIASVVDDSVDVLAPNVVEATVASPRGVWRPVPADTLRALGLRFRCTLPEGTRARRETILAIALRAPVVPPSTDRRGASAATPRLGLGEFNAWLASIPPRERALAEADLDVRKQP